MNKTWFQRECRWYAIKGRPLGAAATAELLYGDQPIPELFHLASSVLETQLTRKQIARAKSLITRRRTARVVTLKA